ncbi:MAG: c-type cytochrome [Betaproteobacteria bacterium]|nr:c-type cytochrome [Betaproteobacteria bacterium]
MNHSHKPSKSFRHALFALGAVTGVWWPCLGHAQDGRSTYDKTCSACHAKGVSGAPRPDDTAAWQARLRKNGYSGLFDSALKGKASMPPKGGNTALSDDEVMSAVMHMLRLAAVVIGSAPAPSKAEGSTTAALSAPAAKASAEGSAKGRGTYQTVCSPCHASGAAGAPKLGDAVAWGPRVGGGVSKLHISALKGKGAMPAKGGNPSLADADVRAAVDFMVAQVKGSASLAESKSEIRKVALVATTEPRGKSIFQATCAACHATGIAGAPKVGDRASWSARIKAGNAALYASAIKGKGVMPPKGGNAALAEEDITAAVDFMVAQLDGPRAGVAAATGKRVEMEAPRPVEPLAVESRAPLAPPAVVVATPVAGANDVNAFNRLLAAPGKRNLPPLEDGIHDATNEATGQLQAPLHAYAGLPKSNAGNRIDWAKAIGDRKVTPRADKQDTTAEMAVLDLNIVREVKGSMPDVVYPHRQHTQWLDCSNCHPAIFIPQKGANQISMASIILGQKCGVCHGKVAFPISECRLCHSKAKDPVTVSAGVKP